MITYGVIGSGAWGSKVIKAIRALGYDVRVCNRSGEYEGQAVCRDYKELIPQVDIVWVATHPSTNCEIAAYAIEHGKPTVVEKPVAFTSQQVAALVRASKARQVPLIVDYIYLFNRGLQSLRLSNLHELDITIGNKGPSRDYSALWDYGSHGVAVALDLFREPIAELGITMSTTGDYDVALEFQPDQIARVTVSNTFSERIVRFEARSSFTEKFVDTRTINALHMLIGKIARLHLRNEFWSNGDLAVEVTDVLERLHKLLPKA